MSRTALAERKTVGVVEVELKAVDGDGPHGSFEAVLSAPTKDRDGEIVDAKAFEPLPARIPIDIDHAMSVRSTAGSGVPFYDGDLLKIRGTFASTQLGQEVRALVTEGHITKMSVAFMNPKREVKDGVPHVVSGELLNAAIVMIPSNRDADITAAKAALKVGARNSSKDSERLQQIHDLAVENGADCSTKDKGPARPAALKSYKSVAGSYEQRAELLRAAIRTAHPEAYWVSILATFDDAVVYELDGWEGDAARYQAPYAMGLDGAVSLGSPEAVEVTEVISPVKSPDVSPERKAAAPAAASVPASDASVLLARALADELETLLA
jgi:hypothetical protein